MSPTPTPEPRPAGPGPRPSPPPDAHRRVRRLAATWMGLVLGSVAAVSALILWHLVRRGRLIRENLGPPRAVQLPEPEPTDGPRERPEP